MMRLPKTGLEEFCRRWQIDELSVFGSVLREDFDDNSDIDVLVDFSPGAEWSLFDLITMQDELEEIMGRDVDLLSRKGVSESHNSIRREAILSSARTVYKAA